MGALGAGLLQGFVHAQQVKQEREMQKQQLDLANKKFKLEEQQIEMQKNMMGQFFQGLGPHIMNGLQAPQQTSPETPQQGPDLGVPDLQTAYPMPSQPQATPMGLQTGLQQEPQGLRSRLIQNNNTQNNWLSNLTPQQRMIGHALGFLPASAVMGKEPSSKSVLAKGPNGEYTAFNLGEGESLQKGYTPVSEQGTFTMQGFDTNTGNPLFSNSKSPNLVAGTKPEGVKFQTKAQAGAEAVPEMDPESLKFAAEMLRTGQQFNTRSMGTKNYQAMWKEAVAQNKAAGNTPAESALNRIFVGTAKSELNKLQQTRGPLFAFEETARRNADVMLDQSSKVDRTGSPAWNRFLLWKRGEIEGDPEVMKLNIAVDTFLNEYTRVVTTASGGNIQVAQQEREHMRNLVYSAQNHEALKGVVDIAKMDMKNRKSSIDDQIDITKQGIRDIQGTGPKSSNKKQPQESTGGGAMSLDDYLNKHGKK